jgi:hypothetical protein
MAAKEGRGKSSRLIEGSVKRAGANPPPPPRPIPHIPPKGQKK